MIAGNVPLTEWGRRLGRGKRYFAHHGDHFRVGSEL
jgi:hypothetical protein